MMTPISKTIFTLILWAILVIAGTLIATLWDYVYIIVFIAGFYFAPLIGVVVFGLYCMRQPEWVASEKYNAFFFIGVFIVWILALLFWVVTSHYL